tara:strand:+ start:2018 stop:2329 length:312 start_codon:yes stop_codon:yes gene_type:complete
MTRAAEKWAMAMNLPRTEKTILMALARSYSLRRGRSERTQTQIAAEVFVTRETVNRGLKSLERKKVIQIGTLPRKKGQWDRRFYVFNGFTPPAKASWRPASTV